MKIVSGGGAARGDWLLLEPEESTLCYHSPHTTCRIQLARRVPHGPDAQRSDDWQRYLRERFDLEGLTDFAWPWGSTSRISPARARTPRRANWRLYLWRHSKLPVVWPRATPAQRPDIDWSAAGYAPPRRTEPAGAPRRNRYSSNSRPAPAAAILPPIPEFQTPDGRSTVLAISPGSRPTLTDLNGSAQYVASSLLVKLNAARSRPATRLSAACWPICLGDVALPPSATDTICDRRDSHWGQSTVCDRQ
jgi:hypothetical protein